MGEPQPGRLSPVQNGVQIVTEMVQLGMSGPEYEKRVAELHMIMAEAAFAEIRNGPGDLGIMLKAEEMTLEQVTSEEMEGSDVAEAYWAATSRFYRRVFQACAAGCN
jgi:hypothetical protein